MEWGSGTSQYPMDGRITGCGEGDRRLPYSDRGMSDRDL